MDVVGGSFILCAVDEEKISSQRSARNAHGYKIFYPLRFNTKQVRLKNWDARDRLFLN
jgi:hypothetical protein